METQADLNYKRIEKAIEFLKANYKRQPSLDELAEEVCLSPFHFQRMFQQWAGVSPKLFLQYLSAEHAKELLKEKGTSLSEAAFETGLSGTGRLHDLFIKIEAMTPGEYKNGGQMLTINYSFDSTLFGNLLLASTARGICYIAFSDQSNNEALAKLKRNFPNALYCNLVDPYHKDALKVFSKKRADLNEVKLHVKASTFQLKAWEALLKIPFGGRATYAQLANQMGAPGASRAVGTALATNPVAFLIPCHRIIRSSGDSGQYHWGGSRKAAMLGWEAAAGAER